MAPFWVTLAVIVIVLALFTVIYGITTFTIFVRARMVEASMHERSLPFWTLISIALLAMSILELTSPDPAVGIVLVCAIAQVVLASITFRDGHRALIKLRLAAIFVVLMTELIAPN